MNKVKPILVGSLSDEVKGKLDAVARFRGNYIENMIYIEGLLNSVLYYFFEAHKKENVSIFMKFYQFPRMDFTTKATYVQQIVRIEIPEPSKYDSFHSLLLKLIELRNIVAHNPVNINSENIIEFIRPDSHFDKEKSEWWYQGRPISIAPLRLSEIYSQIIVVREALHNVLNVFKSTIENETLIEVEKNIDQLNEDNIDLISSSISKRNKMQGKQLMGIYNIGLKV